MLFGFNCYSMQAYLSHRKAGRTQDFVLAIAWTLQHSLSKTFQMSRLVSKKTPQKIRPQMLTWSKLISPFILTILSLLLPSSTANMSSICLCAPHRVKYKQVSFGQRVKKCQFSKNRFYLKLTSNFNCFSQYLSWKSRNLSTSSPLKLVWTSFDVSCLPFVTSISAWVAWLFTIVVAAGRLVLDFRHRRVENEREKLISSTSTAHLPHSHPVEISLLNCIIDFLEDLRDLFIICIIERGGGTENGARENN